MDYTLTKPQLSSQVRVEQLSYGSLFHYEGLGGAVPPARENFEYVVVNALENRSRAVAAVRKSDWKMFYLAPDTLVGIGYTRRRLTRPLVKLKDGEFFAVPQEPCTYMKLHRLDSASSIVQGLRLDDGHKRSFDHTLLVYPLKVEQLSLDWIYENSDVSASLEQEG